MSGFSLFLFFVTAIYFCAVYVGHERTRARVCICCFSMQTLNTTYLTLSYQHDI